MQCSAVLLSLLLRHHVRLLPRQARGSLNCALASRSHSTARPASSFETALPRPRIPKLRGVCPFVALSPLLFCCPEPAEMGRPSRPMMLCRSLRTAEVPSDVFAVAAAPSLLDAAGGASSSTCSRAALLPLPCTCWDVDASDADECVRLLLFGERERVREDVLPLLGRERSFCLRRSRSSSSLWPSWPLLTSPFSSRASAATPDGDLRCLELRCRPSFLSRRVDPCSRPSALPSGSSSAFCSARLLREPCRSCPLLCPRARSRLRLRLRAWRRSFASERCLNVPDSACEPRRPSSPVARCFSVPEDRDRPSCVLAAESRRD